MNSPQLGSAQVAQNGALAARKDGRHPSPSVAQSGMPNGINTTMKTVKAAGRHAIRDRATADPACNELRPCDNTVLIARYPRDQAVAARFVA
jgi:hypothetical protein